MAIKQRRSIEVWAAWAGINETKMGMLHATPAGGKEVFSFEYDPGWLSGPNAQALDPSLQLYLGPQYPPAEKANFGIFLNSSPDRWGRTLMKRREAQASRAEGRPVRPLHESDFLLGVFDGNRMGGLRFRLDPSGPFLDDNAGYAAPPWTSLRTLEHASLEIEKDDWNDPEYSRWLKILIAPGSSIGGARPKAGVLDKENHPWIAKFPSRSDDYDVGLWEYLAYELALLAGVESAPAAVRNFSNRNHTFLTKRFDRTEMGERVHFASALTLLGRSDGEDHTLGASYLEIAEFIMRNGARPKVDLEEIWRRIVFSICISNVDDHLRNHGFLLTLQGWVLSPAYDLNPVAYGDGLKLNISEDDNVQDLALAASVAPYFRIKEGRAASIIGEVTAAVKGWRGVADSLGISTRAQQEMENAFRVADSSKY